TQVTIASATDAEVAALRRIAKVRAWIPLPLLGSLGFLLLAMMASDARGTIVVAGGALVTLLSLVLYVSFRLRCPRCASWIPMPSSRSKCTSCGLSLRAGSEQQSSVQ